MWRGSTCRLLTCVPELCLPLTRPVVAKCDRNDGGAERNEEPAQTRHVIHARARAVRPAMPDLRA